MHLPGMYVPRSRSEDNLTKYRPTVVRTTYTVALTAFVRCCCAYYMYCCTAVLFGAEHIYFLLLLGSSSSSSTTTVNSSGRVVRMCGWVVCFVGDCLLWVVALYGFDIILFFPLQKAGTWF